MKVRREVLKSRTTLLLAGAMAIVAGSSSGVWAADVNVSPISPPPEGWYFNGELEAGVRAFIQRPPSGFGRNSSGNFLLPTQTDSRAKFQEYGEIRPGLFLDWIYLNVGSNDGRYRFNFLGTDVGYNAQRYEFDFSEAGKQYLTLGWDQTPHLYSTSAKSLFSGVGTTNLTVADPVQAALQAQLNNANLNTAAGLTARNNINNIINGNATHIDQIELQRDTFSAGYRFTPTPDWDFNVGYSHLDRTGTQPKSLNYGFAVGPNVAGFPSSVIGVPVPVDDTTQTPEASGEYAGAGPWGRFNVKLGYAGSIYTDNLTQLNVQNPFCLTCTLVPPIPAGAQSAPNDLRLPLPPSNQAHAFTASGATDVPLFKSRFTTTNQYSRWTQNDAFIGTSINGLVADPLPAQSLNGEVTNFLSNNVLTSTLTPTLNNKVRYRYYEHLNNTTVLPIGTSILSDTELQVRDQDELLMPEYTSYKKTNLNEDLTWHPWRWFTLGAGYEYERWQRSNNRFAIVTNENLGHMFADTKLTNWAMWRVSYSYGARRYDDYRIDEESWLNARMFDLANRNQQKARTLLDIDVTDAITLTPNAGLRWDDYPQTVFNQLGLSSDHSWNAGIEAGWLVSPTLRLTASYSYEQDKLDMAAAVPNATTNPATCNSVPTGTTLIPLACTWGDNLTQTFHTVLASADWKAIPNKLDFRLSYVASWERESHDFTPCPGNFTNCNGVSIAGATPSQVGLPWPDNTALYQRFDATARYYVDPDVVRLMGWKGQVVAKLRYTFERNSGSFWQSDAVNAYFGTLTGNTELTGASRSIWLAYNNPNYTAQIIAASLAVRW